LRRKIRGKEEKTKSNGRRRRRRRRRRRKTRRGTTKRIRKRRRGEVGRARRCHLKVFLTARLTQHTIQPTEENAARCTLSIGRVALRPRPECLPPSAYYLLKFDATQGAPTPHSWLLFYPPCTSK